MLTEQFLREDRIPGLEASELERRLARAVVGLLRNHQEVMQSHRSIAITVFCDRKTGEVKANFVVAGKE
ncbi:MAG: hypothetical protein EPO21_03745 [Chloroflexota bacterium]|nr:MAG: hypothetical protein EPO21_03745 [Chloroflexota bacterium]